MIPASGCSEGLDVFRLFFLNLEYNTSTAAASVSIIVVRNAAEVGSHRRNELHDSPVRKHVILLQQGQFPRPSLVSTTFSLEYGK